MAPGSPIRDVAEYRPAGSRNFIRVHDWVRADPPTGRAFHGTVVSIRHLDGQPLDGADAERVELVLSVRKRVGGSDHPQAGAARTIMGDHIARLAQSNREVRGS